MFFNSEESFPVVPVGAHRIQPGSLYFYITCLLFFINPFMVSKSSTQFRYKWPAVFLWYHIHHASGRVDNVEVWTSYFGKNHCFIYIHISIRESQDIDFNVERILTSSNYKAIRKKSPSLRDLVNSNGVSNGPMMHSGLITTLEGVVDHYNKVPKSSKNPKLDIRLALADNLRVTEKEKKALVAFLKTLSGKNIYTDKKWSNPFINQ